MKGYSIIIWDDDWADEFNVFGFNIIEESELDNLLKKLSIMRSKHPDEYNEMREFYFGTNEWMDWTLNEMHEIISDAIDLSEKEYKVLIDIFRSENKGQCFLDQVTWVINEILKSEQ